MMDALLTEPELILSEALNADIAELKKLWLSCFDDLPEAADMFFDRLYDPVNSFIVRLEDKTVSMLFLLPCRLCGKRAHYLYAACTAPEHRGKGIMRALIDFAHTAAIKRGDSFSLLLPASEGLYRYYEGSGYVRAPKIRIFTCDAAALPCGKYERSPIPDRERMILYRENALKGLAHLEFGAEMLDFAIEVNKFYGGRAVFCGNAYALVSGEKDGIRLIIEMIADNKEISPLLSKIRSECPSRKYVFRLPCKNTDDSNCEKTDFGMIKSLDGSKIPENIYIGLTLD